MISWRRPTRLAFVAAFLAGANMMVSPASAEDTIKIGVLHSLSGTMAISETTLKDTILMMVDELNANGGLLDKTVEAVVVDPASNWPLFAEKARELIEKNEVAVYLVVGLRYHVNPSCQFSKSLTAFCFIRFNTKVRNPRRMSSIPVLRRTNKPSPPSII